MGRLKASYNWLTKTKLGFFTVVVVFFWIKTYLTYITKFNLGVVGPMQKFLLLINPLPTAILLIGIGLFFKGRKSYWIMVIIDFLLSLWLFSNILYYREFSDFLSTSIIKTSGSTSDNLGKSIAGITKGTDFLVFLDVVIIVLLIAFKVFKIDVRRLKLKVSLLIEGLAVVLIGTNLTMAQKDRSGLLTRTFDNNYIVKYLGLNAFAVYDGVKTAQNNAIMAKANHSDLKTVQSYIKKNYIAPNPEYYGVAKNKNVLVIHLESFQQFLIDYKWDGKEVTPNLNKLYHANDTISFDNFFNQVGQGKTSDAEMMLENSIFGLQSGSAMSSYGTSNTFESAPAILDQKGGYTSAVMHGGAGSFWNRDNAYKSFGYDYFMPLSYYQNKKGYYSGYGIKDKLFFEQSIKYMEHLPQPFYLKMITVTNHYPYDLDKKNQSIDKTDTGDKTVDGYVQTAHYLDQAVGELMSYLKKSGLEKNTLIMLYGDHYGISGNHHKASAQLLDKDSFNNFDNLQFQRVPLMFHMPGLKGGINHTYGGEIDVRPTLFNLLGINDQNMIQFGHSLLAKNAPQIVAQRNGDFITPKYSRVEGSYYYTKSGKRITHPDKKVKAQLASISNTVTTELSLSDRVITGNLLRFYRPDDFKYVKRKNYSYKKSESLKRLKKAEKKSKNSLWYQKGKKSTQSDFKTDAPELKK
ncbi:glycerol phosphate lipoteichoic acid synthase [Lactobacillus taiwanensis]|jgi:Phosphoglycerol transferase and related proteins, alkaline phosphatase superfamily|uniref:Glycerol phosphate lipoteichoic acid synthase n=2 Tax=Lactobacillus taiwanensis TaxID=508451 RepID=A0A256LEL8_9LACO|nr:LTA synthase family protein [Lactobacillus taiwanensis]OYR88178.1 glycerol phosphate lipoteichoic acid synthase [Lactobacillus taiwanensis]OYR91884.1 glycerol phosphate lipoteichoic acid synthase [Lactobacillus taiwanensis]OYR95832.1 glycerol phosphate lipoteichoic acid synthase [Lactobacillus taiwanensis]OYS20621.1 glycerol phosphate lipoteichoic acid synthase [Lactobacillus taiwanensis]OYS20626.1 glycerol phosphate lipoteichoic acid synthase [Lactobacillus taiwanensis]